MNTYSKTTRLLSVILAVATVLQCVACSKKTAGTAGYLLSDPNSTTAIENTINESVITENLINEFITEEIYLNEIIVAEDTITELLLEEEQINEVMLCKVIYVSESHIEEFAQNSQTSSLFGENIDWSAFLKKISIGTGVIVTLVVLKKAKLPDPICSIVAEAADKSLEFSGKGAAMGAIYGGLTGAADEIDKSGRTSAVVGLAITTVGLILSIIGIVASAYTVGASGFLSKAGVDLVFAGISAAACTVQTVSSGIECIKTFKETDATEIDWDNIDWEAVGCSAAEKAIEDAGDGYMWGAIVGAVYGGTKGYFENFHKFHAPYSTLKQRVDHTPSNSERGQWTGERGKSTYELKEPIKRSDGIVIDNAPYENGVVDLSRYSQAEVKITNMTDNRYQNFKQADDELAKAWSQTRHNGRSWTARDIEKYRTANDLSWHEMNNMSSMQLVPEEANASFGHLGGVGEYKCSVGLQV